MGRASQTHLSALAAVALATLIASGSTAQPSEAKWQAAQHFDKAVHALEARDYTGAVREFEAALAAAPHPAVLFNIGQAYAKLDRPIEAVAYLERYLAAENETAAPARRAAARSRLGELRGRVASLTLAVTPEDATVTVDGEPVPPEGRADLPLLPGQHVVQISAKGYAPREVGVQVPAGVRTLTSVELVRRPAAGAGEVGRVQPACLLPDVAIAVGGRVLARSKGAGDTPFPLAVGTAELDLERPGYAPRRVRVTVGHDEVTKVDCHLEPLVGPHARTVPLVLPAGLARERFRIDGGAPRPTVPPGRHWVTFSLEGGAEWKTLVTARMGQPCEVHVPVVRESPVQAGPSTRTAGHVLLATAAGFAAAGTVLYAVSADEFRDHRREQRELNDARAAGATDPSLDERQQDADAAARRIERLDAASATVFGASVTAGAVGLTFSLQRRR